MIHYNDTALEYIKRNKLKSTKKAKRRLNLSRVIPMLILIGLIFTLIYQLPNALDANWEQQYVNIPTAE